MKRLPAKVQSAAPARETRGAPPASLGALEEFLALVPPLYFRLRAFSQSVHGEGEFSGARRSLMRSLAEGAATVPQLARARSVARQVTQRLVDELARDGLIAFAENPQHRRSKLVRLTPAGERRLREMLNRERQVGHDVFAALPEPELRAASGVMRRLIAQLGRIDPSSFAKSHPPGPRKSGRPGGSRRVKTG